MYNRVHSCQSPHVQFSHGSALRCMFDITQVKCCQGSSNLSPVKCFPFITVYHKKISLGVKEMEIESEKLLARKLMYQPITKILEKFYRCVCLLDQFHFFSLLCLECFKII